MQTVQHIFLVGFMGCGKTFWGRQLAQKMTMPFLDLDELIVQREQKSILNIFSTQREEGFRRCERDTLRSIPSSPGTIVATGGGTPCFFENMDWMNANGTTVFLDTPTEILLQRLMAEKDKRPLLRSLADEEIPRFVTQLLASRVACYRRSKCVFPQNEAAQIGQLLELINDARSNETISAPTTPPPPSPRRVSR